MGPSDVVVVTSEPNILPKRSSFVGRVRSTHLSVDLDNAEWQQKIMKAWPKKSTFVVREILQTERDYILSLEEIILGYMLPLHGYLMSQGEGPQFIHTVFSNIIKLQQIHETLLSKLHAACGDPQSFAAVFIETDFDQYREYCTNFPGAHQYLQESLEHNEKLRIIIVQCQHDLEHALPLHSHLIKPVQRILKYKLMLQEVLRDFDTEDVAYSDVKEALQKMRNVAEEINTSFNKTKEAASPATIAHRRSKEIKYLQTRRVDRQRRTTYSDSPAEELQRSLEFEETLSLLRSPRSSSLKEKKGGSSDRQATPTMPEPNRKPETPIDDIVGFIEATTPSEELTRSREFEDSMSLLRTNCSNVAQQKRLGRKATFNTIGAGRKPRVPITDIVGLFDTVKPAEASSNASSAYSSTSISPSVAPSSSSVTKPFHLLPPKPLLAKHRDRDTDEHSSTQAGKALMQTELPNSPSKKEPLLPTKAPASPKRETSHSSATKLASLSKEKKPILPHYQRNLMSQPKEHEGSRKYPLLPNKEKVEHLGKQPHPQPVEKEPATGGETADRVTARKPIPTSVKPLPPLSPGVARIEKPPTPKKPDISLLPDKKLPQKKVHSQGRHKQWNHPLPHSLGFPTKFVIDVTADGGPTVSLPPPLPSSPASSPTFLPSMLKPLKNSAVRDSVFAHQKSIVGELKHNDRQVYLEPHDEGKRSTGALKQSSVERKEGGGEARKTPLLPPANLPASAHVKLQATN